MPKILSFKYIENKHDVYRGKDFLISKEARNEDNLLRKMKLLTNKQQESYENAKFCYICKEKFEDEYAEDKIIL